MDRVMIKFDVIPTWTYLVAIGLLVAGLGAQEIRVSGLKTEVADKETALQREYAARAKETAKRFEVAMAHGETIKRLQSEHATAQQLSENTHAAKIKELEAGRRADAALAGRLRGTIATFTARDRRPGETDAAAVDRYADRLAVVGGLLTEGVDLVAEGRAVVGQRDAEVARLLEQIQIDRAACTAPAGASGAPQP